MDDVATRIPYLETGEDLDPLLHIQNLLVHLTPNPPLDPRDLRILLQKRIDEQARGVLERRPLAGRFLRAVLVQRAHLSLLDGCVRRLDGEHQHLGAHAELALPAEPVQAPDERVPVRRAARGRVGVPVVRDGNGGRVALVGVDDGEVLGSRLRRDHRSPDVARGGHLVFAFFDKQGHRGGGVLRASGRELRLAYTREE
jgi:hypothetical protein